MFFQIIRVKLCHILVFLGIHIVLESSIGQILVRWFIAVFFIFSLFGVQAATENVSVISKVVELLPEAREVAAPKLFFGLPNSFSFRPFAHKSLETEGFLSTDDLSQQERRSFNFLGFWSVSHLHLPDRPWSWGFRFSPSFNYYSWQDPGQVRFIQATYNAKLLWHFKKNWGSAQLALGAGPLWIQGEVSGVSEKKLILSPRLQLSYYKFLSKRFFVQLKYNKHYLLKDMFQTQNFSINNFSSTGIYLGYFFDSLK
jgi:hypothetical protein